MGSRRIRSAARQLDSIAGSKNVSTWFNSQLDSASAPRSLQGTLRARWKYAAMGKMLLRNGRTSGCASSASSRQGNDALSSESFASGYLELGANGVTGMPFITVAA